MIDFTSSLYLGLKHGSDTLPGWDQLTLGKPAALDPVPGSERAETALARLIGCEQALLAPSTLHLYWDLCSILARRGVSIFLDAGTYPIARWGVERAAALGVPVRIFPHYDVQGLEKAIRDSSGERIAIVADGYCPSCGRAAPLRAFLELARLRVGLVLIDDTQALGISGRTPRPWAPYGTGGGGSMQHAGVRDPRLLVASSLAKAFGVPLAVLSGSEAMISGYRTESHTRMHCSPPSVAAVAAAIHALKINQHSGDSLRMRLAQGVARFRGRLRELNLLATDSLFPVQPLQLPQGIDARAFHETLLRCGLRTALHRGSHSAGARISFVITAEHNQGEIDYAAMCLGSATCLPAAQR